MPMPSLIFLTIICNRHTNSVNIMDNTRYTIFGFGVFVDFTTGFLNNAIQIPCIELVILMIKFGRFFLTINLFGLFG